MASKNGSYCRTGFPLLLKTVQPLPTQRGSTEGPPGVTGYTTGRPAVREVFAYWPALVAKSVVQPEVQLLG